MTLLVNVRPDGSVELPREAYEQAEKSAADLQGIDEADVNAANRACGAELPKSIESALGMRQERYRLAMGHSFDQTIAADAHLMDPAAGHGAWVDTQFRLEARRNEVVSESNWNSLPIQLEQASRRAVWRREEDRRRDEAMLDELRKIREELQRERRDKEQLEAVILAKNVELARYRTGAPGRPGSKHLVLDEFARIVGLGEVEETLCGQACKLGVWLKATHTLAPPLTQGSIENIIRTEFRRAGNPRRGRPPKKP